MCVLLQPAPGLELSHRGPCSVRFCPLRLGLVLLVMQASNAGTMQTMKTIFTNERREFLCEQAVDLARWGLDAMTQGKPVILYHGTTRLFRKFDLKHSRDELVNRFYGRGLFFTPDKRAAERYAEANRNIGFDPSIIDRLRHRNAAAGDLLAFQVKHGFEAGWDQWFEKYGQLNSEEMEKLAGGLDLNDVNDVAPYVIGSKAKALGADSPVNIFSMSSGLPGYVYDTLDSLGIDSKVYRPKLYTVSVQVENPLVTASQAKARTAAKRGHDAVIYYGPDIVGNAPEVAVYDPSKVRVKRIEVL